jgi:dTDP-4-amino-4,6-dideoxygalactose transaminase
LHTLIALFDYIYNKPLHYAVQCFNFPTSAQNILSDRTTIIDIDPNEGTLDLNKVTSNIDGIIVTNLFGYVGDIDRYCKWAVEHNKILLFDNAASPYSFYNDKNILEFGDGSIISLHHTKPLGFGEGGVIIVDSKYESLV